MPWALPVPRKLPLWGSECLLSVWFCSAKWQYQSFIWTGPLLKMLHLCWSVIFSGKYWVIRKHDFVYHRIMGWCWVSGRGHSHSSLLLAKIVAGVGAACSVGGASVAGSSSSSVVILIFWQKKVQHLIFFSFCFLFFWVPLGSTLLMLTICCFCPVSHNRTKKRSRYVHLWFLVLRIFDVGIAQFTHCNTFVTIFFVPCL